MVKGIRITTSPNDYFPISSVRFLHYRSGYWRQVGGIVAAAG
jgi:hypothetical protein